MMDSPHIQNRLKRAAFTLVEVALALGIVAVALLPLVGMMPIGLAAARDANLQTTHSHILQQISSELGLLPGGELDRYSQMVHSFDNTGRRVEDGREGLFIVTLSVESPRYPGSAMLATPLKGKRIGVRIRQPWENSTQDGVRYTLSFFDSDLTADRP